MNLTAGSYEIQPFFTRTVQGNFLSFRLGFCNLVLLRVFLSGLFHPIARLDLAKSNRTTQIRKISKRRVYNPRTTSVYTEQPERAKAQSFEAAAHPDHGMLRTVCIWALKHPMVVLGAGVNGFIFSSDHGLRWGMSKVSSVKNVRSGKSLGNAKCLAKVLTLHAFLVPFVQVLKNRGWGWFA